MLAILRLLSLFKKARDQVRPDEEVLFFPTCGHVRGREAWSAGVHGRIFEPEENSLKRQALLRLLSRGLGLSEDAAGSALFQKRVRPFLVDSERGKRIQVRLAGRTHVLGASDPGGHFRGQVLLAADAAREALAAQGGQSAWVGYEAVLPDGDARAFHGLVHLIGDRGLSVVSDIDDTIKVSEVKDRKALMANTFLREFQAVSGMADLYAGWARRGAVFHYVSASPWQLFRPLEELRAQAGFPAGTYDLRTLRWTRKGLAGLAAPPAGHKRRAIETLFAAYPGRRFVLVGDSGERDPEIYGGLARDYARRVARIFIRDVTGDAPSAERYLRAFVGLPAEAWTVFRDPHDVPPMPDGLFD